MHIAFAWPGLPDYAARCIRAAIDRLAVPVTVVGTRPGVPIEGMERSLGQDVHWIADNEATIDWPLLGVTPPDVLFVGGYVTPAINALAAKSRLAGGKVVLMSDNNWTDAVAKRSLNALRHRLLLRRRFDGILVPGASASRVARSWGYRPQEIKTGLYGADPTLFNGGAQLSKREKTFLFVGQFIERKNVVRLAEAFGQVANRMPDWRLSLCGSGELAYRIPSHPQISVHGFVQPPQLAQMLRKARCLILPSLDEHWGLVVHEAALSGCALALSRAIGAADDLAKPENSVLFTAGNTDAIASALLNIAMWDDARWQAAEAKSREQASGFGPINFASNVASFVTQLTGRKL